MTDPRAAAVLDALAAARVVPVVRTRRAETAAQGVEWLQAAGFGVVEITMTVPEAPALIAELARRPGLLVGAGTLSTRAEAEACLAAGARFLVSPWVEPELVAPGRAAGAAVLLGAFSPTEVRAALAAGADAVKIFPASSAGGPAHIRALASVFPGVALVPTGGVGAGDVGAYLAAGAAFVGVGGRLVDEELIARGERTAIEAAALELRRAAGLG